VKPHDPVEIIQRKDNPALSEFLKAPLSVIAGALIEGFSDGPGAFKQPLIRVGVAALMGRAMEQFAQEIKTFQEKGKIPDDWAEKPKGYQTWVELLRVIDEESPDEERLDVMKAMFFAVNKVNVTDGQRIVAYQLFQIAKKLDSNELLVMKAIHESCLRDSQFRNDSFRDWAHAVASHLGHSVVALIEIADKTLVGNQLLSPRQLPDLSQISAPNWRLTDLGSEFCKNIERYQIDRK